MLQRFPSTEWLWYLLALYAGSSWSPVRCVAVRNPPNNPATVEAQAKFFQDFFSVQLSPYKIEFGHVCEDPNTWEQRYEKKDFKNHRDMGKVRWGDKKGGYGEHYWDLNHAGHNNDHGDDGYDNDDGSYHEEINDPYDEPSENSPTYGNERYDDQEKAYEETSRNKRAYPKVKVERKTGESYEDTAQPKAREQLQAATHNTEARHEERALGAEQKQKRQYKPVDNAHKERQRGQYKHRDEVKEKQQVVLVVHHNDADKQASQHVQARPEPANFVPYESGAGVRQHQQAREATAASAPRLFLEPSTGHVVDRTTGQAYVLQPIKYK